MTMNVCIPILEDRGLQSPVCEHFGSAPMFLIVDIQNGRHKAVPNRTHQEGHGGCQPLASLEGENVGAMMVGGIGRGALAKLQATGVVVFVTDHATVQEALAAFQAGRLQEIGADHACAGHGHGGEHHGHGHDHGGSCGH